MRGAFGTGDDLRRDDSHGPIDSAWWALAGAAACLLLFLWMRNAAFYPQIFSDEYQFSVDARLKPLRDALAPAYAYLLVYRLSDHCGSGFLDCARALNLAFFTASCGFVFLCARRVVTARMAALVALLALASPFNAFTANFMPESMYAFGFWVATWVALGAQRDSPPSRFAVLGALIGGLALIKPHGAFVIPPVLVYCALLRTGDRSRAALQVGTRVAAVLAGFTSVKFGAGSIVAGRAGLTLFGASYTGLAGTMLGRDGAAAALVDSIAFSLVGHAMALVLLFAMPIATLVLVLAKGRRSSPRWKVAAFATLTLATLVSVSAVFTANVAGLGPYETRDRLHLRYYDFAFPLLLIVGAMGAGAIDAAHRDRARLPLAIALAAVVVCVVVVGFGQYRTSRIDGPELYAVAQAGALRRLFGALVLVSLGLWWWRPRLAAWFFTVLLMPWFMWKHLGRIADDGPRSPSDFDRAGIAARQLVPPRERSSVHVLSADPAGNYRVLFHLDDASARATLLGPDEAVTDSSWPRRSRWAIVVGRHPLDRAELDVVEADGFVLARRKSTGEAAPR